MHGKSMSYQAASAGVMFGAFIAIPTHAAVVCQKGLGDTEIQCIAKGTLTPGSLAVSSTLGVPVTVLVTQWAGKCGQSEALLHTDSRAIPAKGISIPFSRVNSAQCHTVLFSECRYTELTGGAVGSVQKPFDCGALLDVKGGAQ